MNSLKSIINTSEKFPVSFGGCDRGINNKAFPGVSFECGGLPTAISITVIPNDHISILKSYCDRVINSGAIQYGVPTNECLFVFFFN